MLTDNGPGTPSRTSSEEDASTSASSSRSADATSVRAITSRSSPRRSIAPRWPPSVPAPGQATSRDRSGLTSCVVLSGARVARRCVERPMSSATPTFATTAAGGRVHRPAHPAERLDGADLEAIATAVLPDEVIDRARSELRARLREPAVPVPARQRKRLLNRLERFRDQHDWGDIDDDDYQAKRDQGQSHKGSSTTTGSSRPSSGCRPRRPSSTDIGGAPNPGRGRQAPQDSL